MRGSLSFYERLFMKAGFAKIDITPRVGVELSGFGPFITRHSTGVRDPLWARAMAVELGGRTLVLVSCDLIGFQSRLTRLVRGIVREQTGVPEEAVMVHCTHTHSGPCTAPYIGWGAPDETYLELIPGKVARACVQAVTNMKEAEFSHASVPCEGIGFNREYDTKPEYEKAMLDNWRPAKPELTDTVCHVIKAMSRGETLGFLSYFGCHPVVCCSRTRRLHGDFCGVANTMLEKENPGSVGMFLQGANGDIDTCVCHRSEEESLKGLDVIACRYAGAVRRALASANPLKIDRLACAKREVPFTRKSGDTGELRRMLDEKEKILKGAEASDSERDIRMAMVYAISLKKLLAAIESGAGASPALELQGFRLGPLAMLASPFETFQAIKNDVVSRSKAQIPLVMSCTNDTAGYAPDRKTAAGGGYAADFVPLMCGTLPFAKIHDELVERLLGIDEILNG
jgi:hypothetical protein